MKVFTYSNVQALGFALVITGLLSRHAVASNTLPQWTTTLMPSVGITSRSLELCFLIQTLLGASLLIAASVLRYLRRIKDGKEL